MDRRKTCLCGCGGPHPFGRPRIHRREAAAALRILEARTGSLAGVARAYADRFGVSHKAGERLIYRVLAGERSITERTLDRLTTLAGTGWYQRRGAPGVEVAS